MISRSPLKRSGKPLKKMSDKKLKALGGKTPFSTIRKKPRPKSATLRIYGPPARREWMKTLPCSACGVVGYSEGAHVLGNGGMSRKADYDTQAPLCGPHWMDKGTFLDIGCHRLFDRYRSDFDASYPRYEPEQAAADTRRLWLEHSRSREAVK